MGVNDDEASARQSALTASAPAMSVEASGEPMDREAEAASPAWTADQAARWREAQPKISPTRAVWVQAAGSGLVVLLVALTWGWQPVGESTAWGWLSVVVPAVLMAWGLRRTAPLAGFGLARFFAWEWAKLGLSVVLMLLAPRVVSGLNWLALLAGVILAVKAHWLALWWLTRKSRGLETKNDLNTED